MTREFNVTGKCLPSKHYMVDVSRKLKSAIEFVGAISAEGAFLPAKDVKALADLPTKPQLIAGIINTLQSPIRGVMSGLQAKKQNLGGELLAIVW